MPVDLQKLKVGDEYKKEYSRYPYKCREIKYSGLCVYVVDNKRYFSSGRSIDLGCDIIEIIPKESEVNEHILKAQQEIDAYAKARREMRGVTFEPKPKRFVDLLAEGVEYIADCDGDIWNKVEGTENHWMRRFSNYQNKWFDSDSLELFDVLWKPATPAQNPERKKKVVYQVLYRHGKELYLSSDKYESLGEFLEGCNLNQIAIRLIEESREEIEE